MNSMYVPEVVMTMVGVREIPYDQIGLYRVHRRKLVHERSLQETGS